MTALVYTGQCLAQAQSPRPNGAQILLGIESFVGPCASAQRACWMRVHIVVDNSAPLTTLNTDQLVILRHETSTSRRGIISPYIGYNGSTLQILSVARTGWWALRCSRSTIRTLPDQPKRRGWTPPSIFIISISARAGDRIFRGVALLRAYFLGRVSRLHAKSSARESS